MFRSILMAGAALLAAGTANATTVEITSGIQSGTTDGSNALRALGINYYGPVGQSFLATDTNLLSFGFQLQTFNAGDANTSITLSILSGSGTTGTLVASKTATAPRISDSSLYWLDFDFTGTTLTAGETYTALLSTSSLRIGLVYGPNLNIYNGQQLGGDAYADGTLVSTRALDSICTNNGNCDANFRFTATTPAAVPEPATWAMFIGGFGLVGGAMRRRRIAVRFA